MSGGQKVEMGAADIAANGRVDRNVMPHELVLMLAEAYARGFADGMGASPEYLANEAMSQAKRMPILGKIAGVDVRRVRIMKRAVRAA